MEENITPSKGSLLRFRNLVFLLTAIIMVLLAVEIVAIKLHQREITMKYGLEGATAKENRGLYSENTIELLRKKAYLAGRIELAKTDSITLVVSLADSVLRLELKGVIIHKAPIVEFTKSRMFEATDQFAISNLLSTPGTINIYDGTLPKEPIMVKVAPKDTIEALNKPDIAPDTASIEPVYYSLSLDNGIRISISEVTSSGRRSRLAGFFFRSHERVMDMTHYLGRLIRGKKPDHFMDIRVKVDARDGRIIYRALPHNARVTVRL